MKRILIITLSAALMAGCSTDFANTNDENDSNGGSAEVIIDVNSLSYVIDESALDLTSGYTYSDPEETVDADDEDMVENSTFTSAVNVVYSGSVASVTNLPSGVTAEISGADVTVTSTIGGVEYVLSGETDEGCFKIYSGKKYKLTLSGVSITNSDGPALNLQSSKRAFIILNQQTINSLTDGSTYNSAPNEEDQKGCIFAEGQIIFSGTGMLSVTGKYKHAICTDDYFRVRTGVKLSILNAASDGIHAKDSVIIGGGILDITSVGDGIQCEDGGAYISGGTTSIYTSGVKGHGLTTLYDICMTNGALNAFTTGNASKGIKSDYNITISGGSVYVICKGEAYYDTDEADINSCCGIKADGDIKITEAVIFAYSSGSAGKGISCEGAFTTSESNIKVITKGKQYTYGNEDSSAKGIKSEGTLTIQSGSIQVQTTGGEGSEAIESKSIINIKGGVVEVAAYDDCLNAASAINVSGGNIYTYSSNNDGMDSNGTLSFSGGMTIVSGTTVPEEGFDCDQNKFAITGGILVGFGGASSTPTSSACTQNSLIYSGSALTGGSLINLSSSDKTNIISCIVPRSYNGSMTVLISSPTLVNSSYTLYSGGTISKDTVRFHSYYQGGSYSSGTKLSDVTISSAVTTIGTTNGGQHGGGQGGWH